MEEIHGAGWHDYLNNMAKESTYGDHQVLQALAIKLSRDIFIVTSSPQGGIDNNFVALSGGANAARKRPLLLGHRYENHYESLKAKSKHFNLLLLHNVSNFLK